MDRIIFHIDFNSYFATIEQQANPRLRGKPIGVTGGDRIQRTVLGAASVEAKRFGVKTGMTIPEAKKLCPQIIIVPGEAEKYFSTTTKFLNILKDYSSSLEVFSIDEAFLELTENNPQFTAQRIKNRIRAEIGEWVTCSIGISYNKLMAKLASSLQKPDGLVVIPNPDSAIRVLDLTPLDGICGIGPATVRKLAKMGIFNFRQLRAVPLEILIAQLRSYGYFLYNASRGIDHSKIMPFYDKEEVKSIGHRHTIDYDTDDPAEVRQIIFKISEMIGKRLRIKNLQGKTVHCWYRSALSKLILEKKFEGEGKQKTDIYTNDGLKIFANAWEIFESIWRRQKIRLVGVSIFNLKPIFPTTLSLLPSDRQQQTILKAIDLISNKYGEFTLQRGSLLHTASIHRKPNPYMSDRRFRLSI